MSLSELDSARQVVTYRLVALDLTGNDGHSELATWETPARVPNAWGGVFSASRDGGRVLILGSGSTGTTRALYLLEIGTGTVTTLFDQPSEHAAAPVLSPDGRTLAFLRMPVEQTASFITESGIWAGAVGDPSTWKRIVEQEAPRTTAPLAWSQDGRWLAFVRLFIGGTVFIVTSDARETIEVGEGTDVDWRAWEPRLLVSGPSNGGPSTGVWTFDVSSRQRRQIGSPTAAMNAVSGARWHPTLERLLYMEWGRQMPTVPAIVWTRYADGRNATKIYEASFLFDVHWSVDGTRIYGTSGGDDSTFGVSELISGQLLTRACWRGAIAAKPCT